jgi:hypothetical protein
VTRCRTSLPISRRASATGGATLDDLEALGVDTAALRVQPPSPTIAALVGAECYWILNYHPVAILGYLELEAYHLTAPRSSG